MVHALETIQRLLRPGGRLIDVHPIPEAPLIEVHQGSATVFAEPIPEYDPGDVWQAEAALAQVVERRLFVVERSSTFDFLTYAASVDALRDFLAESSAFKESAPQELKAWERELAGVVEEVMRRAGEGAEVAFHEKARITRLAPAGSFSPPQLSAAQ